MKIIWSIILFAIESVNNKIRALQLENKIANGSNFVKITGGHEEQKSLLGLAWTPSGNNSS